ncbi:hypothetical protein JP75_11560 [Devosia riboflavina]|uniref:Peptidase U35 n=1 Tax=Devosia riboflavina TaxID=46914 RepID=A0A087M280_9HYPH|nr:hypothetical protein [Devosia riboflavina]KFL30983.1 hypothetical protein JP75_11560 [Devosia riboflavina]
MDKHVRAADLRPATFDADKNTVEVVWTTGAAVRRRDYLTDTLFDEVLSLAPGHVRLDRLNAGAPLLDAHDDRRLASVLGSVVPGTARIENGVGIATIQLSRSEDDAEIVGKIADGIIRHISVGYRTHAIQTSAGTGGAEETRTAIDWEPLEISAVPIPADAGSRFRGFGRDDSPEAARARMQRRQDEVGLALCLRRATPEEVCQMGRTPAFIPDEFWPMVEET